MSTVADFNRIDDCDKIDADCIDAFLEFTYDPDNEPTTLCVQSSWGGNCIDITNIVKVAETLTTLYLSPAEDPSCLVYEPERGDNICIHGDDLSRIISMTKLKDVSQTDTVEDGDVYIFNGDTNLFEPYDLKTFITNVNTFVQNVQQTLNNHEHRLQQIEEKLTPPEGAPEDVKVAFGTINLYSDHTAAIDGSGAVTSLDKTHGLYTHSLNENAPEDEIFG